MFEKRGFPSSEKPTFLGIRSGVIELPVIVLSCDADCQKQQCNKTMQSLITCISNCMVLLHCCLKHVLFH